MNLPNQLAITVLMTPDMANFSGNVHGGTVLRLLDQVACAGASRYAGSYRSHSVRESSHVPSAIHVGELVTFLASVNHTGTTSLEVSIKVITEKTELIACVIFYDGGRGRGRQVNRFPTS